MNPPMKPRPNLPAAKRKHAAAKRAQARGALSVAQILNASYRLYFKDRSTRHIVKRCLG
jgi:hypothetical protein